MSKRKKPARPPETSAETASTEETGATTPDIVREDEAAAAAEPSESGDAAPARPSRRKKASRSSAKSAPVAPSESSDDASEAPVEIATTAHATELEGSIRGAPEAEAEAPEAGAEPLTEAEPDVADEDAPPADTTDDVGESKDSERAILAALRSESSDFAEDDVERTVNIAGDLLPFPGRDDLDEPTLTLEGDNLEEVDGLVDQRRHVRGLLEALIFASDTPIKPNELAKLADAPVKLVKDLLPQIREEFSTRGFHLEELAGGWVFRTSARYAPFIRDLTKQRPVRLTRAQVETLAIIAYRQPITRPEMDEVRGVDSGPVLKLLLERDLVRILGKRDEPGRPMIYGTTTNFLEFFGLKSLKDLPTLREFTELTDESRDAYEAEMGEPPHDASRAPVDGEDEGQPRDLEGLDNDVDVDALERTEASVRDVGEGDTVAGSFDDDDQLDDERLGDAEETSDDSGDYQDEDEDTSVETRATKSTPRESSPDVEHEE